MNQPPGTIRQIAWRELFPWLILFRTFRIAISPTLLALATVAVLVTPLGWRMAGLAFLSPEQRTVQATGSQLATAVPPEVQAYLPSGVRTPLLDAYFELAEPLSRFFQLKLSLGESAFYAFGFLWTLAIWAFPGGFITRRAVVQLASDGPPGLRPTIAYVGNRYLRYFLAPLYPLLGIVLLAVPIALLGLVLRLSPGLGGVLVGGLAWLLVAIAGIGAMWLFGGLIFGWPLMWPTVSAERDGDPFEAFSRSYSYVYGKPLHYFFYVVVAAAFGALSWAVVWGAASLVREFGFWALAWGGGGPAVAEIRVQALDIAAGEFDWVHEDGVWKFGTTIIGLIIALIHAVTAAFRFSFFFCAASAIYLLLRHDVDEKEMDEVYLGDSAEQTSPPASGAA